MIIENINITMDSEIGYHVYIYYRDYKQGSDNIKSIYRWIESDVMKNVFNEIEEIMEEIKNE